MKKLAIALIALMSSTAVLASSVVEGVVEKSEVITGKVGKDGRPILGAAVGAGIGSAFGSGSGKDAAKIVGGLLGASQQAARKQKMVYGWRYIIKTGEQLQVVDAWCPTPQQQCAGVPVGKEVYVINGNEVAVK